MAHRLTVIHIASRRSYRVPRVTAALRRRGRPISGERGARVMREHGVTGNSRRSGRHSLTKTGRPGPPPRRTWSAGTPPRPAPRRPSPSEPALMPRFVPVGWVGPGVASVGAPMRDPSVWGGRVSTVSSCRPTLAAPCRRLPSGPRCQARNWPSRGCRSRGC
ncbi:hypothetical protein [Streptomyces sp. NPDC020951]|uniref:hypothetical protein n=1 Tax=Streptomyces sp. NPDC020951 TaxID=3365104 RepID=UPI0037B1EC49